MSTVSAQLTVPFECPAIENALVLEYSSTFRRGKDAAVDTYLLFPQVRADLYPSSGAAAIDFTDRKLDYVEMVKFQGSKTATLKYPLAWSDGASPFFSRFTAGGCASVSGGGSVGFEIIQVYDNDGNEVRPDISYDRDTNQLVAEYEITGLVRATYTPNFYLVTLNRGRDQMKFSGNIIAMYRGAMAEATFGRVTPEQPITVYSVVSEYVADENGAWEVPPGWPDDNTYPGLNIDPLPNQDSYQQLERVHENAFLDITGEMRIERYTVRWEQPYDVESASLYNPIYTFDRGDAPPADSDWFVAWSQIDWASIEADVTKRYPGIQI